MRRRRRRDAHAGVYVPRLVRVGARDVLGQVHGIRAISSRRCRGHSSHPGSCSTCKQLFTGQVQLRLAIALWAKYVHVAETDDNLLAAAYAYAGAHEGAYRGGQAEAMRLWWGILDARPRALGPGRATPQNAGLRLEPGCFAYAPLRVRGGGGVPVDDARRTDPHARAG